MQILRKQMEMQPFSNFDKILFTIASYQIYKSLGKGGMGEVFLARDQKYGRWIALKKIREDLQTDPNTRAHFLYEARLACQMAHPAIVPIYDIVDEVDEIYFTMPYLEGVTLKELILLSQEQEKTGELPDTRTTLPVMLNAFLDVCHAISYAHSKGVIHRDLKPSNIFIGHHGEAVILDWGLAKILKNALPSNEANIEGNEVVKVTGTVPYVAPEQAYGQKADYRTEVYSLGLILYEILTLRYPFHRESLYEYRQNMPYEVLLNPCQVAPMRGISPILSMIALKALAIDAEQRYQSVDELLLDLENYLQKQTGWFKIAELNAYQLSTWNKTTADLLKKTLSSQSAKETKNSDDYLLISKQSFTDSLKISLKINLGKESTGIAFVFGIPDIDDGPEKGNSYGLWLSSNELKNSKIFDFSDKEIFIADTFLKRGEWEEIVIEKVETRLSFYLNEKLQFTYVQHHPLQDTHIGIWQPDREIVLEKGAIFITAHSFGPQPLAAANAFFSHYQYSKALHEYRKIALEQPFTLTGGKAQFRAGVTMLEDRHHNLRLGNPATPLDACLKEFQKLCEPIEAPLALLGKALAYQYEQDFSEEVCCFETAFDHYAQHPLIIVWYNQLLSRLLESSDFDEHTLYRFLLLAMKYLPEPFITPHLDNLLNSLKKIWHPFYFLNDGNARECSKPLTHLAGEIRLAFWLAKPDSLTKIITDLLHQPETHLYSIGNALCALLELQAYDQVERQLEAVYENMLDVQAMAHINWIHEALLIHRKEIADLSPTLQATLPKTLNKQSMRIILHIFYEALYRRQTLSLHDNLHFIETNFILTMDFKQALQCCRIWAFLLEKNWSAAEKLLMDDTLIDNDFTLLPPSFLRGCWIAAVEGTDAASSYFIRSLINFPNTTLLFRKHIEQKQFPTLSDLSTLFYWEKLQLSRQTTLYYHCAE
jgi:eukaryotic-like serine/threonine-protein kinase